MNPEELKQILEKHILWLNGDPKGEGANLEEANLKGAHLEGANLVGANLECANLEEANLKGAILDFSAFPLWGGSFGAKADDRLILQLFAHIARLDLENCSEDVKKLVEKLPELAKNGFCKYRGDVEPIPEKKKEA